MSFCWKTLLFIVGFSSAVEYPCYCAEPLQKEGEVKQPVASSAAVTNSTASVAHIQVFDITDLNTAKLVAQNILNIKRNQRTQLEYGVDTIMNDHSINHHSSGDSYLQTNDRQAMINLINFVVLNAHLSESYTSVNSGIKVHQMAA